MTDTKDYSISDWNYEVEGQMNIDDEEYREFWPDDTSYQKRGNEDGNATET